MDDTSQLTNLESGPTITPNGRQLVTEMMLTDRELPAVQSFLKLVARRMPSFSFAASAEFNHFIRTVIHEAQRYPTLPPRLIFPHLTYRRIKAIITRASLRQKKNRKLLWRNATIGITFDGGKIGHKNIPWFAAVELIVTTSPYIGKSIRNVKTRMTLRCSTLHFRKNCNLLVPLLGR